jgi:Zn-dependent protease with chaperone function/uncharacterized tellurite resistance protein B-like protein
MNFYEHQDRAERRTKAIVFLFILAVFCLVAIVAVPIGIATEWDLASTSIAAGVCLLIVGIATFVKLGQLRGGGSVVAEMMGGRQLQLGGSTQSEKRVQNIVEEMAIASGMPVPPVYVIEDESINAFAAGWSPSNAVIGVTRGCIEKLNRDELQGVIAHEYSHIAHGDMRMNIRLIGVIFGIMALGITGWVLVRYIGPAVLRSSSRSRSKEGAGGAGIGLAIIVFGLFLALSGCVGTFFGRLIQAAVSRQREFLADASAVQYTRNPSGIGGALRKIGGITPLSKTPADASQCNHMFFSQAMNALFASHPPITQRVARVEGIDVSELPEVTHTGSVEISSAPGFAARDVRKSIDCLGDLQPTDDSKASGFLKSLHPSVLRGARDPWSARLVMLALIVDNKDSAQLKILSEKLSESELSELKKIAALLSCRGTEVRLPLIDFSAPALKQLSQKQKSKFVDTVFAVVKSDGYIEQFEWVFVAVLRRHLFGHKEHKQNGMLGEFSASVSAVLGALAYCGAENEKLASESFYKAVSGFGFTNSSMPAFDACTVGRVESELQKLNNLKFTEKEKFLNACVVCVTHDNRVTTDEAETIRAIGDLLDCPIPMY